MLTVPILLNNTAGPKIRAEDTAERGRAWLDPIVMRGGGAAGRD